MRPSERDLLAAVVETTEDAIVTADLHRRISSWNAGAERLYGYPAADALGRDVALIYPDDLLPELDAIRARLLAGEPIPPMRSRRLRRDGTQVPVSMTASPLRDPTGRVIGSAAITRDLTSELSLVAQRELLAEAVNLTPVAILGCDPAGVVTLAEGGALSAAPRADLVAVGRSIWTIYRGVPEVLQGVREALQGTCSDVTVQIVGRWYRIAFRPQYTRGEVVGALVSAADVTDEVQAQEELRRSGTRFRALLEHAFEIVLVCDVDGRMQEAIFGGRSALGYTEDEITGLIGWDFIHPGDVPAVAENWQAAMAAPGETRPPVEFRLRLGDGSWGWAQEIVTNAVDDPAVEGMVVNLRDVTERRRAQEALQVSERRYRTVVQSTPEAIAVLDHQGAISLANPRLGALLGVHPDQLVGQMFDRIGLPEPDGRGIPQRWTAPDGTDRWVTMDTRPLPPAVGGALVVVADVTDRVLLSQQQGESDRLQAIGRFARGVAHDFGNLLTAVRGNAELLPDSEESAAIIQAADRAGQMVSQLLFFSRGEQLAAQEFDVNAWLDEVAAFCQHLLPQGVELAVRPSAAPLSALADPRQIERVVVNLVTNARDALPGAGRIELAADGAAAHVRVTVADNGCGMTAEEAARCFEPFFTTKAGAGTGLGLASAYGIVRQSGGSIEVDAAPGRGSRFVVTLPRRVRTVLVVDSDPDVRAQAEQALRHEGHTVVSAADAELATVLALAGPDPFDLLLTAGRLPGEDGTALATRLLDAGRVRAVVFLGDAPAGAASVGRPVDTERLAQAVDRALRG